VAASGSIQKCTQWLPVCTGRESLERSGAKVTEHGKFKSSHRSYYSMRPPEVPLDRSSKEVVGTRLKKLHAPLLSGGHQTCAPDGEQCQQLVSETLEVDR
jgi:hypothetical protein